MSKTWRDWRWWFKVQAALVGLFVVWGLGCDDAPSRRLDSRPVESVPFVDLVRYQGTWYNLANFPAPFQKGCASTTVIYTVRSTNEVEVVNRCIKNSSWDEARGTARPTDASNARLKVRFFPLAPEGDYWVLDLDQDYQRAIIGEPSGRYLWIISRSTHLSEQEWSAVLTRVEELGYDVSALEFTNHLP